MKRFGLVLMFLGLSLSAALAQQVYQAHTYVQLVSEQSTVVPGQTFWAGLDFKMDDGWHVYWRNPGDAGLPLKVKWELPSGLTAGDLNWPYPKRLDDGPMTDYGYENEVFLLVPMTVDAHLQSSSIDLHARADWLTCREMCIPGHADLSLSLPVSNASSFNNFKEAFDRTREHFPQDISSISSYAVLKGDQWRLHIQTPVKRDASIVFYPFSQTVIEHTAAQPTSQTSNGYELTLTKSHLLQGPISELNGIAVNPQGWDQEGHIKAINIHAPLQMPTPHLPFWLACAFAFIGGLILNLMPCVLPVLSIKVLHLVERHPDRKIALSHSLMYALGILVSLWALGFGLAVLKSLGKFAGWGFQFQSPVFVLVVALVLLALALNLFGVFEFSVPAIGGVPMPHGYKASFISGVITTVVASPCTAPFMGTALTVAISQPGFIGFGIFTFLGLGLAAPFVLFSAYPSLLAFVPKPGAWMIYLKKALGLILLACVLWMLWVFGIQTGIGDWSKLYKPSQGIHWQDYSAAAVEEARKSGHGVFLDFTAAWCINCQVNDRLVLQNHQVVDDFKDRGVMAFKADWTRYDPAITQALASYGRDSIPVYVYYPPGAETPEILPQLITPKKILERINH